MSDDLELDIPRRQEGEPAPTKCWYVTNSRFDVCPPICREFFYKRTGKCVFVVSDEHTPEKFARRKEIESGHGTYFFDVDVALKAVKSRIDMHIVGLRHDISRAEDMMAQVIEAENELKKRAAK